MTTTLAVNLIIALFAVIAAALSAFNHVAIREVHLTMNSRLDELLRVTREKAFEAGQLEGRATKTLEEAAARAQVLDEAARREK